MRLSNSLGTCLLHVCRQDHFDNLLAQQFLKDTLRLIIFRIEQNYFKALCSIQIVHYAQEGSYLGFGLHIGHEIVLRAADELKGRSLKREKRNSKIHLDLYAFITFLTFLPMSLVLPLILYVHCPKTLAEQSHSSR